MIASNKDVREPLAGRYHLLKILGRGANSTVYLARDLAPTSPDLPEIVAVKVLNRNPKHPSEHKNRIGREAFALQTCQHQNVIRSYDAEVSDALSYITYEFADGGDLRRVVEKQGSILPPATRIKIIVQALAGLEAIHRAEIIHHDIKPENILLLHGGEVKIADFGIATLPFEKRNSVDPSKSNGTFEYLPPEFLENGLSSESTDLYAMGVTLYQLLFGCFPFGGKTMTEQVSRKLSGTLDALHLNLTKIAPELEAILRKALHPSPKERFQSAKQFREALQSFNESAASTNYQRAFLQQGRERRDPQAHWLRGEETKKTDSSNHLPTHLLNPLTELIQSHAPLDPQYESAPPSAESPASRGLKLALTTVLSIAAALCILLLSLVLVSRTPSGEAHGTPGNESVEGMATFDWVVEALSGRARNMLGLPPPSAVPELAFLTVGEYGGVLHKLDGSRRNVPFSISGLGSDQVLITVNLPEWQPQRVDLKAIAGTKKIRIIGPSQQIVLDLEKVSGAANHSTRGTYTVIGAAHSPVLHGAVTVWRRSP